MYRHARLRALFVIVVLVALWGSTRETATQSAGASYGVTDLATIGGDWSAAHGIGSEAFPRIVGTGTTATGEQHAFAGGAGGLTDIGTLGGRNSEARAVSTSGWVAGRAQLVSGAYHAFRYISFEGMVDLGTLGGSESYATAVNNVAGSLVVLGASLTAGDTNWEAFRHMNGVMSPLGATLGGPNSAATDINSSGQVVGFADLPGGDSHHAFLYYDGNTVDLGSLGGNSAALAINSSGIIVGRSQLAGGMNPHAFRYENGAMQDLGTLGGPSSEALDVSSEGVIVGWADTEDGTPHAFIWRDGVMTDLNTVIRDDSGWVLQAATGVGNGGAAIAGYGLHDGRLRAFLLTPPLDLRVNLRVHASGLDTNIPNPHEAGQELVLGVTVNNSGPYTATGVTIVDEISGPVEYVGWNRDCVQEGQRLTCRMPPVDVIGRDLFTRVRATGPGEIIHSASMTADQPDPNLSNNLGSESNTAVSLAALALTRTTVLGGESVLARATLTSRTPPGGARVELRSSHPDIAIVPAVFDVLPWSGDGLWREFYVQTGSVSAPITVEISGTYGFRTISVPLTLMPAGSQWPYGGSARAIPGIIEAEDFDEGGEGAAYHDSSIGNDGDDGYRSTDVDIGVTRDTGGGRNVGWISAGEWLEYTVDIATNGTYLLEARVASLGAGGTFHVEVDGVDKTGMMAVPATGDWQAWTTLSRSVTLDAGLHLMRVSFDSEGASGAFGNLNYLRFVASPPGPAPFQGAPVALPGTVEAEDFDNGGEGIAYHDRSPGNVGGEYRPETDVDIAAAADTDGGYTLGWVGAGEWLTYTVDVGAAGAYDIEVRVASAGEGGTFHIEVAGTDFTGPLTVPNTGDWQSWSTIRCIGVGLSAGPQIWRVVMDTNGATGAVGNINYIRVAPSTGNGSTPFPGAPAALPGTVEAENFR
jgi:uncharacterized repeat protein (TIGR01451 family)